MQLQELTARLEEDFPLQAACAWDHVGLQTGRCSQEITRIFVGFDPTEKNMDLAAKNRCDLLLTHHPLLFKPCFSLTDKDPTGKRLLTLMQNDVACYAMHTNYDTLRMARLAAKMLKLTDLEPLSDEGIGIIGTLSRAVSAEAFCGRVKEVFSLPQVILYRAEKEKVKRIAVVPGAGRDLLPDAVEKKADLYLTGDTGHHDGLDAVACGMHLADAGHYGLEKIFIEDMAAYLKNALPKAVIFTEEAELPYQII